MIPDYSEVYLDDVMRNLGEMVEYATVRMHMDIDVFWRMFLNDEESLGLKSSNPSMFGGKSGTERARDVIRHRDPGTEFPPAIDSDGFHPEYWCGWVVGYCQWYTRRPFHEIAEAVPMSEVLRMYPAMHEASEMRFVEAVDRRFDSLGGTRLSRRRERLGYSQSELARRSGVSIRMVQKYEQGDRDINRASAETVLALSKALMCEMKDILECNRAPEDVS